MDVEIEQPHRHHPTGHHWLDKILPVSALFISLISIMVAYHHGEVMQSLVKQNERLVQANSLPFLELYSNTGPGHISFTATNAGVGPAEIKSAQILVNGKAVERLDELLKICCGAPNRAGVGKSNLRGRMLRPGDTSSYIVAGAAAPPLLASRLQQAYEERRIETRLCYCSVFGECWTRSSFDSRNAVSPRPVKSCPMTEPQYLD